MTTVRGPLMWYFDGSHRNLTMVDVATDKRWIVNINSAPGFGNDEVYHPRWTNHPRFIAMSGPYNLGGANQVRSGGAQTEVWLGRFSDDYSRSRPGRASRAMRRRFLSRRLDRSAQEARIQTRLPGTLGPAAPAPAARAVRAAAAGAGRLVVRRAPDEGRPDPDAAVDRALSARARRQRLRSHRRRRGQLPRQEDPGRAVGDSRRQGAGRARRRRPAALHRLTSNATTRIPSSKASA